MVMLAGPVRLKKSLLSLAKNSSTLPVGSVSEVIWIFHHSKCTSVAA